MFFIKNKICKSLFIIHNLKEFTTKKQVQNYIKNNLKKSSTFKLEEGHIISTSPMMCDYPYYFYEIYSYFKIYHYFFAKEGSEAGSYFNNFTKESINKYFIVTNIKPFDFFNTFKESFVNFSSGIFEKGNKDSFVIDDFVSNDEIIRNKMIKLKKPNSFNVCFN